MRDGSIWHTVGAEEAEGFSDRGRSQSRPTSGLGKAGDPRLGAVSLVNPLGPRAPSFPCSQWALSVQALTCAQGPPGSPFLLPQPRAPVQPPCYGTLPVRCDHGEPQKVLGQRAHGCEGGGAPAPRGPAPRGQRAALLLYFPFLRGASSALVPPPPLCLPGAAGPRLYLGGRCGSHNKPGRLPVTGHPAHVMPGRYK